VRLWWLLRWLGHENVGLLDGGLQKWQREKRPLTADAPAIVPARFEARPNAALCADAAEVADAIRRGEAVLDARAEERFIGFVEPLDKVAGHIPGAMNRPFEDNLDLDGTLLGADELRAAYLEVLGATPPQRSIHMCGSGVSACHNLLAMEIAGLSGARLYPGSWSEWITDPSRPTIKED
jgi:thiosulfate/3-mercaptopyruvate sulfurtransferase